MTCLHLQQIEKYPQKIFKIVCEFDRVRRLRFQQFTHELFFISFMFDTSVNCRYYSRPTNQRSYYRCLSQPSRTWRWGMTFTRVASQVVMSPKTTKKEVGEMKNVVCYQSSLTVRPSVRPTAPVVNMKQTNW